MGEGMTCSGHDYKAYLATELPSAAATLPRAEVAGSSHQRGTLRAPNDQQAWIIHKSFGGFQAT